MWSNIPQTILFTLLFSAITSANPVANPGTASCKRGDLTARCFGKFTLVCTPRNGRITIAGGAGRDANPIPIDCHQITTCDKRGRVVFRGHAENALPAAALNACANACTCEAG